MRVLFWNGGINMVAPIKKNSTFTQNIVTCRAEVLWCDASQQEFLSFALMASNTSQTQKCHLHGAVQVHEGDCFQPSLTLLEPVFALYLDIQVDEKLTINGVNRAHYTESFAYTSLENTKSYCRRTAGFRKDQVKCH